MFAIIDIETTGGSPERDKITDICIVLHDGLAVEEVYSTLINPERSIPAYITRLTGINDEMVKDAPKFYEVARKIVELTEGRIFVAHNVNFDYGFVKNEFKSLGYTYKRDTLCTVRLSRKLLPKRVSYSLGKLCDSLGIVIEDRHRAQGDAEATAKLFDILLLAKNNHPVYKKQKLNELNTTRIDSVKKNLLNRLPEECGVYYYYDKDGYLLYIGKSKNIKDRAFAHLAAGGKKTELLIRNLYDVDYTLTGSELLALLIEGEEIKLKAPPYNRAQKQSAETHCIGWHINDNGIVCFSINEGVNDGMQPLKTFPGYIQAREQLNDWIEKYELCLSYCGITEPNSICFNRQIHLCKGICNGEEETMAYNKRAYQLLNEFRFEQANLLLIDKGPQSENLSIVGIRNHLYYGYGILSCDTDLTDPADIFSSLKKSQYPYQLTPIIKTFLKKNPILKTLRL